MERIKGEHGCGEHLANQDEGSTAFLPPCSGPAKGSEEETKEEGEEEEEEEEESSAMKNSNQKGRAKGKGRKVVTRGAGVGDFGGKDLAPHP